MFRKNMLNFWMQKALKESEKSLSKNEVPVGAIIVFEGEIIGRGHNQPILNIPSSIYKQQLQLTFPFSIPPMPGLKEFVGSIFR